MSEYGFALIQIYQESAFGDDRQGAEQVCKTSLGRFDSYRPHEEERYGFESHLTGLKPGL